FFRLAFNRLWRDDQGIVNVITMTGFRLKPIREVSNRALQNRRVRLTLRGSRHSRYTSARAGAHDLEKASGPHKMGTVQRGEVEITTIAPQDFRVLRCED